MGAGIEVFQNRFIPVPMLPVGIPFFWPTEAERPNGVLELNGDSFSAEDYPELARVYPSLILPDMRGVVPRGLDGGSGRNVDAADAKAGDYQEDETGVHGHTGTASDGGAHGHTGSTASAGAHTHTYSTLVINTSERSLIDSGTSRQTSSSSGTTSSAGAHTHTVIIDSGGAHSHDVSISESGGTETRGKAVLGYWLCFARTMFYDLSIEGGNAYYLGGHPASYYVSQGQIAQMKTDLGNAVTGGYKNKLINGNFDIWQRGTSASFAGGSYYYLADRWHVRPPTGGSVSVSRQTFGLGQNIVPNKPTYYLRYNQTTLGTGLSYLGQKIEGVGTCAGKKVTVSFNARADKVMPVYVAVNQYFNASDNVSTASEPFNIDTDFSKRYSVTIDVPPILNDKSVTNDCLWLQIHFPVDMSFTVDIAQVQLEEGTVATAFEQRHIAQELALCQRYYEIGYNNPACYQIMGNGFRSPCSFKVTKRIVPTVSFSNIVTANADSLIASMIKAEQFIAQAMSTVTGVVAIGFDWTADAEL